MIKILTTKECILVTGAAILICPDGVHINCVPHGCKCPTPPPPPTPRPIAICTCLDYVDNPSSGSDAKTMDDCWNYCCKNKEIHAAKFGKYARNCCEQDL
jgi:hypothetical protein